MTTDYKQTIIDSLEVLRKRDVADKAVFSARAYAKVVTQLKNYNGTITEYDDIKNITGIGAKMEKKIKEILETGTLAAAENARELYNIDALDTLQNIYGVGPAKATELVKAGIISITQLREEVKSNPKLLNDKQKIGLKYYEELLERIPRTEMEEHRDILHTLLPDEMTEYDTEIVGSFRREAANSGDIDVLIRVPFNVDAKTAKANLELYVNMLKGFGYIEEILALGEHKCMAISRMYNGKARRLDLLMTPDEEYAYSILYFTGSDRFNVAFRQYAIDKGYTLNEHTLTPIKAGVQTPPYMKTEKDIFKFLGLRYIDPSKRVDGNQIISIKSKPKIAT
uniref:DNA polymerase beta n=1 Tax=viral metagenome TaxID=1070528 RepID=A0A6C0DTA3_9ZZZZ